MNNIEYRHLPRTFAPQVLSKLLTKHGMTEHNWCPEDAVAAHLNGLTTGVTQVWAGFAHGEQLVGFITAYLDAQFSRTTDSQDRPAAEIGEFVVNSQYRGLGIGTDLAIVARKGVFREYSAEQAHHLYVMAHAENRGSVRCFSRAGFTEVLTYADTGRRRKTTVMRVARPMRVLSLQPGNAMDGIDVCVVDFDEPRTQDAPEPKVTQLNHDVVAFEVCPWPEDVREEILALRDGDRPAADYARGNYRIAECFVSAALSTLSKHDIPLHSVALISSHGQSILGRPHWELDELSVLAQRLGVTTVGGFRPADVATGDNGSPCTCSYDALMLQSVPGITGWRVCINIGGTTSVTFCPPEGSSKLPFGLDSGLGVFFMDLNARLIDPSLEYDDGGELARAGTVHGSLLGEMLQHSHFQRTELPVSVGAEDFPRSLFHQWLERANQLGCTSRDFQATLTELTARSIALACQRFGPTEGTDDIIVRGNVHKNIDFMERLRLNLCDAMDMKVERLGRLQDLGIDEQSWETVMYAMFGFLRLRGLPNSVPSCTGARAPVSGGKICPGDNYALLQRFYPAPG